MSREFCENASSPTTTLGVLRIFAVDMLILAVVFVAAEVGLRLFAPQNLNRILRDVYVVAPDTLSGYRFKPGAQAVCNNGFGDHDFSVNRWGMRDRDYGDKQPGEYRILVVGDSFCENLALDVEQIYPKVLEQRLNTVYPDRTYSVLNAGMAGWGIWSYFEFLKKRADEVDPDLVVLAVTISGDYVTSTTPPRPNKRALRKGLPVAANASLPQRIKWGVWYVNQTLETCSHAYIALRRMTVWPESWLGLGSRAGFGPLCTDPDLVDRVLEPTADVVGQIASMCEARGIRLALLYVPRECDIIPGVTNVYVQVYNPDMTKLDPRRPAELIARIADKLHLPLHDPADDLAASPERVHFKDFAHWNELGNQIVADGLLRFLEREHLLNPLPTQ